MILSKINKKVTLEYLKEPVNLYYDRKSAKADLLMDINIVNELINM